MLETVVSKFIAKYLKQYIETLSRSQMEMEIWKGKAVFENLSLKSTALSSHGLPFKVKMGTIKSIYLNFPWKKLNSQACIVEVSDVFILLNLDLDILIKGDLQAKQSAIHTYGSLTKEEEKGTWQSFINTVIDNARINIKNIHIKLEIPHDCGYYTFGIIIPELTLFTVDDNNIPLLKVVKKANKLRKRLNLNGLSVYLDTMCIEETSLTNFSENMKNEIDSNEHQFLLNPFFIECILLHTRNVPDMLKNIIEITSPTLKFSFDLLQCKAINELIGRWNFFNNRRKFSSCLRPKEFEETQYWLYFTRCALRKLKPNKFNPSIALKILKNRKSYLKLYRKKIENKIPHPILKNKIKSIEKKVGETASLFLREYAEAVIQKEISAKDSGLTALDLSELKKLIKTTDKFFDSTSFSIILNVPLFQIDLVYSTLAPLCKFTILQIESKLKSIKDGATFQMNVQDMLIDSYINNSFRSIITTENKNENESFLSIDTKIPATNEPLSMEILINNIKTIFDIDTIHSILDFLILEKRIIKNNKKNNNNDITMINRIDIAQQLKRLLYFKNHLLNLKMNGISFVYPFVYNENSSEIKFSISDISISKAAVGLLTYDAPEIKMDFNIQFYIDDFLLDKISLLKRFKFDFIFSFTFFNHIDKVILNSFFGISNISIDFGSEILKILRSALIYSKFAELNYQENSILGIKHDKPKTKTIISFNNLQTNIDMELNEMRIYLNDVNSCFNVKDIKAKYKIFDGKTSSLFSIGLLSLIEDNIPLISLPSNSTNLIISQENDVSPFVISLNLNDFNMLIDLDKYKNIYTKLMNIMNSFKSEVIKILKLNKENENVKNDLIKFNDKTESIKNKEFVIQNKEKIVVEKIKNLFSF